jgi:hypothetical protein
MPRLKVLLTVTTYPLPSRTYDDLVCTAGLLEDGTWIRIYPIPLGFLNNLKRDGVLQPTKYSWIELNLKKRSDDFRPESHSPEDYEFKDLVVGEHLGTDNNWSKRKEFCLKNIYTNRAKLVAASKKPNFKSLATFKPAKLHAFIIEKVEEDWDPVYAELKKQGSLFPKADAQKTGDAPKIKKVPYKFYYKFEDDDGKISKLMIEDWEIGQLYWNCLRRADYDEEVALEKVRYRYEYEFFNKKDIYLFLGTTKKHHNTSRNPFVIIGVFYPKLETQFKLF